MHRKCDRALSVMIITYHTAGMYRGGGDDGDVKSSIRVSWRKAYLYCSLEWYERPTAGGWRAAVGGTCESSSRYL